MSNMFNNYIGKAGQLFAMSEFLMRGWNVAIPEVDRGEDIFVVQDSNGTLRRVQVKSSRGKPQKKGYFAQFSIPYSQIVTPLTPDIYFLLIVRYKDRWQNVVTISREKLANELGYDQEFEIYTKKITLRMSFTATAASCQGKDFTKYLSEFDSFDIIGH